MSITGDRMKERRKQLDINADTLAEYLGVSRTTVFRYENGDIDKVPAKLLTGIAKFLKTSEQYLMGWEDNPEAPSSSTSPLILDYYELLNDAGKHEATKRVKELTELSQYTKSDNDFSTEFSAEIVPIKEHLIPNAAHHRTDIDTAGIPEDADDKYFDE